MEIENDKLIVIREYKGLYSEENLLKKIIHIEFESSGDDKISLVSQLHKIKIIRQE